MNTRAFSLIELVIVVVIIGVIAAVAVPRVGRATDGAADAALRANLSTLRSVIDMYAAEHNSEWPAQDKKQQTLIDQLTKRTNLLGNVGSLPGEHIFGPYLMRIPGVPVGPNKGADGVKFNEEGKIAMGGKDKDKGWVYNRKTGHIYANSDQFDSDGVAYKNY